MTVAYCQSGPLGKVIFINGTRNKISQICLVTVVGVLLVSPNRKKQLQTGHYMGRREPAMRDISVLPPEQEAELVRAAQAGDAAARDRLIMGCERVFSQIARKCSNDHLRADDLLQDAFEKLCDPATIDNYQPREGIRFIAYAARIARNLMVDKGRRMQSYRQVGGMGAMISLDLPMSDDDPDGASLADMLQGSARDPADIVSDQQQLRQAAQTLMAMPTQQRRTAVMRLIGEDDVGAVAEALGIHEGSVKTHSARASDKLRTALGGNLEL
jgi:RNA polymerase sigma factor (sigma-70 family)